MERILVFDYQKEQLDEIQKKYEGRLKNPSQVVGELLRVYEEYTGGSIIKKGWEK